MEENKLSFLSTKKIIKLGESEETLDIFRDDAASLLQICSVIWGISDRVARVWLDLKNKQIVVIRAENNKFEMEIVWNRTLTLKSKVKSNL